MKKVIALILTTLALLVLFGRLCFGQKMSTDTIRTSIYTSVWCDSLHQPLYVSYKLYKGGGTASRKKMRFKGALNALYAHSGYDKGHLCPAEDMAYSYASLRATFQFNNCIPQYHSLNAGIWATYEDSVRRWSQSDSLLIITGGADYFKDGKLYVPEHCWKAVYSLSRQKWIFLGWFTNRKESNTMERISVDGLKARLNYELPITTSK